MSEARENNIITQLKSEFLECPVCKDQFNQIDRRPRLLQTCLHAFCSMCLERLLQNKERGQLSCPICRHVEGISGKGPSPSLDLVRSKLVDFVKMKEKEAMCTNCPDGNLADSRCQECSYFLCKECRYVHKRHMMTTNHSVLQLETVLKNSLKQLSTRHFCTKHPNHQLEFFCSTDESLCCLSCTVLDHQGHKFEKIEEALAPRQQELDSKLNKTKTHAISLRDQRQRVEREKATILKVKTTTKSKIEKNFSKLKKAIKLRKESLLNDLEQDSEEQLLICQKKIKAIGKSLATIESTQSYISQANQNSDAVEMLQMFPALKQSLAGSSQPPSPGAAEQTPRVVFDPCFVSTAEKIIPLIGQLEVQRGVDQPSGAREYRDCVQQVMSVCLDSRDRTELRRRINQELGGENKGKMEVASSVRTQTSQKPKPVKTGDRIPGEMTSIVIEDSCGGYENFKSIQIRYHIPAVTAATKSESEVNLTAYLPNSGEGQKVLSLLKVAWERGLTFKLQGGVWWLQIRHKKYRNPRHPWFGPDHYPAPNYLKVVQEELRKLGVTEKDI